MNELNESKKHSCDKAAGYKHRNNKLNNKCVLLELCGLPRELKRNISAICYCIILSIDKAEICTYIGCYSSLTPSLKFSSDQIKVSCRMVRFKTGVWGKWGKKHMSGKQWYFLKNKP